MPDPATDSRNAVKVTSNAARDAEIAALHERGAGYGVLAREFRLSRTRIRQIVEAHRRRAAVPLTDPIAFVEDAIAAAGDNVDLLRATRDGLNRLGRELDEAARMALVMEDDRERRVEIVEQLALLKGELVTAHERFLARLAQVAAQREDH